MTMDEFLETFDESKSQQKQEQLQLEGSIVALLEQVVKTIEFGENVPSAEKMKALKVDRFITLSNFFLFAFLIMKKKKYLTASFKFFFKRSNINRAV